MSPKVPNLDAWPNRELGQKRVIALTGSRSARGCFPVTRMPSDCPWDKNNPHPFFWLVDFKEE